MPVLVVESGPLRGKRFRLPEKGAIGIGRDAKCAIQLADPMCSRVHCILRLSAEQCTVEDQQSLNKTFVNGEAVDRRPLAPGDTIRVGDTLLSYSSQQEDALLHVTIGGCRIDARLGRGAMGTVYRAHQISVDRPVALKILAAHLASDGAFTKKFLDEARAAARLNHPNIVQVHDAGRDGDLYYISMEYLPGGSLQELLDREGRLEPARAVAMAVDAAQALTFAAERDIVHRDIKPANLFLTAEGAVKVGDLGIAADLRRGPATDSGQAVGSPRYMAPEQIRGEALDHRADIYALGGTLYRAIAGAPPFEGASVSEILKKKLEGEMPPLRQHAPEVSAPLAAVVHKMLARDPEARYATAAEAGQALLRALDRPAGARMRRTRVVSRRPASNSGMLVGVSTVGVLILFVVLVAVLRSGDKPAKEAGGVARPVAPAAVPAAAPAGTVAEPRPKLQLAPTRPVPAPPVAEPEAPDVATVERPESAAATDVRKDAGDDAGPEAEVHEASRQETVDALAEATRTALRAAGALDFAAAEAATARLESKYPFMKEQVQLLRGEIQLGARALERLETVLTERQKDRKAVSLAFPPSPLDPESKSGPRLFLIADATEPVIRVQPQGQKTFETRSILRAEPGTLLALMGAGAAADEWKAGLGWLVAWSRGPDAARALLLDGAVPEANRSFRQQGLEEARASWLGLRLEALEKWVADRREGTPPQADAWDFAADEAADLLVASAVTKESADSRKNLRKLFLEVREKALVAAPPEQFFHAKEMKSTKEGIELSYDFAAREQLDDFVPSKGVATTLEWVKAQKAMKLMGEVRFLHGEPFLGKLSVTARAAGFDGKAPNVNVALWTNATDALTPRPGGIRLDRWRDGNQGGGARDDVFVLGMGYWFEVDFEQAGGRRFGELARGFRSFLPLYLREPTLVLLAAAHGRGLHSEPGELIWEMSSSNLVKPPLFVFTIAVDAKGELQWLINRRPVPFQGSAGLKRLASAEPRRGSVSFFSNGGAYMLSQIKIAGQLDPAWIESRARAIAAEELKRLESSVSGEKAADGQNRRV